RSPPAPPTPTGRIVADPTYPPFHQHFLVARLDMDIDGPDNTVVMSESYAEPIGRATPQCLSLVTRNIALRSEAEARQDVNFATQRAWKVVNPNVVTGIGAH